MSHVVIAPEDPTGEIGGCGRFKCDICDRSFHQKKDLLHHAYIHKENPNYDCPTCGKILTSKVGYDRHMGSHQKGKKAFHCKICQRAYTSKTDLEEHHRKYHLEQKPFMCEICKAEFSWEENLHKHQRMHLVENYQCEMCNKVFVDTISLKVHMRTHTEKKNAPDSLKPYGCKSCGQRFQYDFSYNAHMRLHDAGVVPSSITPTNTTHGVNQSSSVKMKAKQNVLKGKIHIPDKISVGNVQMRKKENCQTKSEPDKENPELSNARILPAFVPPKTYRPYPKMLSHRANNDPPLYSSKDMIRMTDDKNSIKNKDKKPKPVSERRSSSLRFGDLSMTQETPHKCNLCDQSFRWKVSLKVHIEEHLKGPNLSAAEIRRRDRYALHRNIPSMLSRKRKPALTRKQKNSISPKKSRLVKRTAGSDDEDSDVEVEPQNRVPVNTSADISGTSLETNQTKHVDQKTNTELRQLGVQSTASQTTRPKPILVEPQTHVDEILREKPLLDISNAGNDANAQEVQSWTSGTQARMQTRTNDQPPFVISDVYSQSNTVTYTNDSQSQSNQDIDLQTSTKQPVSDTKRKVVTRSRSQSNKHLQLESDELERSQGDNEVNKSKLSPKPSARRGGKRGKGKAKSGSSRRNTRLKFTEPQTETEIEESVAELAEIANTTFEEAVASINVPLPDKSPELQSTEFKDTNNLSSFDYNQQSKSRTPPLITEPRFEERRSIIAINNEHTTDGPFFLSSEPHGPVIANIIHDDKTVEQVQVVECIKSAIKIDDDDDDNDEAVSVASIPEGAYEYENQSEGQLPECRTSTHRLDSPTNRHNPVYANLGNVYDKDSSTYTDLRNIHAAEKTSDNHPYQLNLNETKSRTVKGNQISPKPKDKIVLTNYSNPAISIGIGDSIGSVSNSTMRQYSPKSRVTFSTIDSANIYGTANSILIQNEAQRNHEPNDDKNEIDYATVTNAEQSEARGTRTATNNPIALPIFTVNMTTSANSQLMDSNPGVSVIEPINDYVPFTGSMLEALNNQQPISATSFSHLYPGPIAEEMEGYPPREKSRVPYDSSPTETHSKETERQIHDASRDVLFNLPKTYNSQSDEADIIELSQDFPPRSTESQIEQTLDLTGQTDRPMFSPSESTTRKDNVPLSANDFTPIQHQPRKSYSLPTELAQELGGELTGISQNATERNLQNVSSSQSLQREISRNLPTDTSQNIQTDPLRNIQTDFSGLYQTSVSARNPPKDSPHIVDADAPNIQTQVPQPKARSVPTNQPVQSVMHQQVMGSQLIVQGDQGSVYQSHLMQNALTVSRQGMVENKSQMSKEFLETSMPPNKTVHEARAVSNLQQTNHIMNLAQPYILASGAHNSLQNPVLNIASQPPKPISKTKPVVATTKQHTVPYQTVTVSESNQANRLHVINSQSMRSVIPDSGAQIIVTNAETLVTSNAALSYQSTSVPQTITMDSQSLNQAVNLSIPRNSSNPQHTMFSISQPLNFPAQNIISSSHNQNSVAQNALNLAQPIYSVSPDTVIVTQSLNTVSSHSILPKPAHYDGRRTQKQNKQQTIVIQQAPAAQMLLSPSRLSSATTILPPSGIQGIHGSNPIIIQGQSALQGLGAGGIQVVNAQGALQNIQPQGAVQVLSNQGIQNIQSQGGLPAGLQPALQPTLPPNLQTGLQAGLPPGFQVVQNVQQDNVSVMGSQPSQGGYQLVQTPSGIQMVPVQPSFPSIQGGLPFLQGGFQHQSMGPISMINMNITNNVQSPMQPFQTNVPNIQGGLQMIQSAAQGLNPSVMSSPITCLNQFGELVTVTPLFQIPMEQLQNQQTVPVQNNVIAQNLSLGQGLVQMPVTIDQHGNQIHALNMASNVGQSTSNSPINMVCKENPIMGERDTEGNADMMKDDANSSHLIVT